MEHDDSDPRDSASEQARTGPGPGDRTILVVDDEQDARDYLALVLEDAGFNVVTAVDGNDALEKVRQAPPDFISLDLVMPGKSGIRFLHELRRNRRWARIPFVIVTAHAGDEQGREDLQSIMSGKTFSGPGMYLEKPVKPEQYVQLICQQLGVEHQAWPAAARAEELRAELQRMIQRADPEQLEAAIRALEGRRKP
jgi:CheY-like chemotaxis protein